ncbi:F-box domain-containing protein [Mycena indigotica]|uniref:F-box domain-containing protein n=1 Tax=Mycena indigotica TaxID=2126181 RepID=A0A8H6SH52_9AGAR|nr:F-box domain-containing protein [Mycena indigotica]KAF7298710.1 F-box domain-containing protein [Mycena indigotica]
MISLASWPDDVLLRLGQELDICDLISLLATCRALRALQDYRTLWIAAVHRIRYTQLHPLPLAQNESISSLPLARLQTLARQTNRLLQNWHSDAPRPAWTRSFHIGKWPMLCIPGTYLVITVSYSDHAISCWDARTGAYRGRTEVPHLHLVVARPFVGVEGRAMLGATVRLPDRKKASLAVIELDFSDRTNIRFNTLISPSVGIVSHSPADFFLNDKIIAFTTVRDFYHWTLDSEAAVQCIPNLWHGMIAQHELDTQCIVVYVSNGLLRLRLFGTTPRGDGLVDSFALDVDSDPVDPASTCQLILLSEAEREGCLRHNLNTNSMWHYSPLAVRPDYGVYGVSWSGFNANRNGATFYFTHFWPTPVPALSGAQISETVDPSSQARDSGPQSICHGHPSQPLVHTTGVSGRYVLQIVGHPSGRSYEWGEIKDRQLALVFLDSDGESQFRRLHLEGEAARCLESDPRC